MALFRLDDQRRFCAGFGVAGTEVHVGLLADDQELCTADQPRVHHIRPPRQFDGQMTAHFIGHLVDLTGPEIRKLQDWITLHRDTTEYMTLSAMGDYVVYPHYEEVRDSQTRRYQRTKFSCSGFVQEAYRAINVILVDVDGLPVVTIFELSRIWPVVTRAQNRFLPSDPSKWRILLPAHILQSLARAQPRAVPHRPTHNQVPDLQPGHS